MPFNMDPFQREVLERLTRIETRLEASNGHGDRITKLETGATRLQHILSTISAVVVATIGGLSAFMVATFRTH